MMGEKISVQILFHVSFYLYEFEKLKYYILFILDKFYFLSTQRKFSDEIELRLERLQNGNSIIAANVVVWVSEIELVEKPRIEPYRAVECKSAQTNNVGFVANKRELIHNSLVFANEHTLT